MPSQFYPVCTTDSFLCTRYIISCHLYLWFPAEVWGSFCPTICTLTWVDYLASPSNFKPRFLYMFFWNCLHILLPQGSIHCHYPPCGFCCIFNHLSNISLRKCFLILIIFQWIGVKPSLCVKVTKWKANKFYP